MLRKLRKLVRMVVEVKEMVKPMLNVPVATSMGECLDGIATPVSDQQRTTTLDLGCGGKPRNEFGATESFGVDIRSLPEANVRAADLTIEPIPFDSDSFDFVTAFDFLEHVPRVAYCPEQRFPFVALMNEVWRVLKPGGLFLSQTPIFPYPEAFQDPTHVNIMSSETLSYYFTRENRSAQMYGFDGAFEIVRQRIMKPYLVAVLRKVAVEG